MPEQAPVTESETNPAWERSRSLPAGQVLGAVGSLGALGVLLLLSSCAGELEGDPNRFTGPFGAQGGSTSTGQGGSATTGSGGMAAGGTTTGAGGTTPGSGGMGADVVPPDDPCVAGVMQQCEVCHSKAVANLFGVDLVIEGPEYGKSLVGLKATYKSVMKNPDKCIPGALIIDPTTPANSVMLKKVSNDPDCGEAMPGNGLLGEQLSCIQMWISKF